MSAALTANNPMLIAIASDGLATQVVVMSTYFSETKCSLYTDRCLVGLLYAVAEPHQWEEIPVDLPFEFPVLLSGVFSCWAHVNDLSKRGCTGPGKATDNLNCKPRR